MLFRSVSQSRYGNGGGQAASTAGGTATQPNAPKTNPAEVALQQQSLGLQLKQIEAQNRLANAGATKTIAEANKIAGVDTKGQELQNKWQEIENRIQTSRESIEQSNMKQAAANADKAVEDWKISVLEREYLDNVQEERVTLLVSEIAKIQKEGSAASTAGGTATQPSAPNTNPIEVALQQESMGLQLKQIEAQNRLANAEATKTIAEANKIAGVDTKGQELQNKWQEIENRIQTSRENIEQSNMKAAAANADKAIEDWKMSVLDREYLDKIQEDRVARFVSEIAKIQKEGSLAESATDVNYLTARKIEKEVENFYYEMMTRRMSAEAAKEAAENMLKKLENEYKLGSDQNLREWIYGGVDRINGILETIAKFKNGAQILEAIAKKTKQVICVTSPKKYSTSGFYLIERTGGIRLYAQTKDSDT